MQTSKAADAAVSAAYGSAGERCMAVSVVVAVGMPADPLVGGHRANALPEITVGAGNGRGIRDGAARHPGAPRQGRFVISTRRRDAGATVVTDGRQDAVYNERDGFFLGFIPDRQRAGRTTMSYKNKIFGPVLEVMRVATYEEALRLINENPYGNGTAIFTRDGGAARRFQFEVETGMVGINVPIPVPVAYYSFGGWKASLFGDSHVYGPDSVGFYTRGKVVTSRGPTR